MPSGNSHVATVEDKLELLVEASATLLSSVQLRELLPAVLELARKLNSAEACGIWQQDDQQGVWRLASSVGLSEAYHRGAVIPKEAALHNELPLYIEDTRKWGEIPERRPFHESEGIRALLIIPMKSAGVEPAALALYYREPHRFSDTELRVATALANLAASAVRTARLYERQERTRVEAERARRRAAFLAEASSVLASSLDYETTLAAVAHSAIPHIADWCVVHTLEPDGSLKQIAAHSDPAKEAWAKEQIERHPPLPNATTGPAAVARTGKPELRPVITDRMLQTVAQDPEHLELLRSVGFASFMCVPLLAHGRVLGTMSFVSADPDNRYGPEDLALAEDLARRAATAVDNALLYASIRRERVALETALLALKANEQRLMLAMEAGRFGIWDWDIGKGGLNWTENLLPMHGLSPSEFDGTLDSFVRVIHPDDRGGFLASVDQALVQKSYFEREFRVVFPDGAIHWISGKGKVFCRENGEPERMIGLGMDVTDRRLLEEQVRKSQRLESVGLLAGGIAHDFNNLLTGIMGNAGLAIEYLPGTDAAIPLLRNILSASERAANLTQQLLAYSGKGQFVIEALDLSVLVRQIVCLVQVNISKLVSLELELDPKLPSIEGDTTQIQQVIMNLLINAAEAMDERPGRVLVKTGLQTVDQRHIGEHLVPGELTRGEYVYLEVQDTGCGMSPEIQAKIFDPFYTTKFTGRGLGLAAVSGIVRGHRGAIKVYSAPGQGSAFRVWFPVSVVGAPSFRIEDEDSSRLNGEGLILLIDDEEPVRSAAEATLRHFGYQVVAAQNGEEAVDRLRAARQIFSAVILDLTMPVPGGVETLRLIREIRPDIPVIGSSGHPESEAADRFPPGELAAFLQKPYSALTLGKKLRAVLPESKMHRLAR